MKKAILIMNFVMINLVLSANSHAFFTYKGKDHRDKECSLTIEREKTGAVVESYVTSDMMRNTNLKYMEFLNESDSLELMDTEFGGFQKLLEASVGGNQEQLKQIHQCMNSNNEVDDYTISFSAKCFKGLDVAVRGHGVVMVFKKNSEKPVGISYMRSDYFGKFKPGFCIIH